jgi:SNF2 family DNA or RNA helicase
MILHGIWSPEKDRFRLWAEQAPGPGRGRAGTRTRPHPFAAPAEALAQAAGIEAPAVTFVLRLPARGGRPLPSPELARQIGEGTADPKEAELSEWKVPALELRPEVALEWLCSTPEAANNGGSTEGSDLRFWRAAGCFAVGLLRRERWLPTLERGVEGRYYARWAPALNLPEDAARFRALAAAMPAVCRAGVETEPPPGREALLRSFLTSAINPAVRAWADTALVTEAVGSEGSPSQAWVAALLSPEGKLSARPENVRPLEAALRTWLQPVQTTGEAGFRTCFRLDPPQVDPSPPPATRVPGSPARRGEVEETDWWLSFWLQAIDEPSLLVPAEEVWERGSRRLSALGRRWEAPQERMLPALARAGRLFPPVEEALKSKKPLGCALSTPEAYQFLREVAPLLEETGNGVVVPDWWRRPSLRLGVRLRMRSSSPSAAPGIITRDRLIQFDWHVALGDEPLSPEEFAQLASLKTPLVRLRGRWLEVRPDEVERAIRAWERRRAAGPMSLLDALQLQDTEDGLPVTGIDAEGELRQLLSRLQGEERPEPVPVPEEFRGRLRPYQQYGLEWLAFLEQWGLGACLADDMGLGKTIQTLAYLLHARRDGRERPPALLVCPTSLVENWRREAARFAPSLRVYVHHGARRVRVGESSMLEGSRLQGEDDPEPANLQPADQQPEAPQVTFAEAVAGSDLVVTTYPLALRDEEVLRTVAWDAVILDEAQNIKNPEARQTRAIRGLAAGTRIAMTGTPVENRLTDLWSVMEFLNPGFLGSRRGFRRKYAVAIERDRDPEVSERLRRLTRPFILRRVKTDPSVIQDLPEKQEMKVVCTLTSEQATLYEAVVREMLEQVEEAEGIQRRGLVLSTLSRLKQVCNHPAQFLHDESALPGRSGKLERLVEMLEEVFSVGEAALVFTQFAEMGEMLRRHLQATMAKEALFLHGGVPRKARDGMVEQFQSPEGPPVMVLSLKAGGVGLNLTRASHVFHFDRWWNPAVENQATDRAFRIGQTRNVQVHKFLCAGTLEDQIDQMIEQKQELAQNIIGTGEEWLTELSTAQFRDLISLRRDAIASE